MSDRKLKKGIILAGGTGSRLFPITRAVNKHLLPIYDRPLIYFPLSVLMMTGIREVLLICGEDDIPAFERLLGDGGRFGISLQYAIQSEPRGIADAFLVGESFIAGDAVALILGDNIFFGDQLGPLLKQAASSGGANVFACPVEDPHRFGIVELGDAGKPISLEEKPIAPRSNLAVTGLYFYDIDVVEIARKLTPSRRGELEITDLNAEYMARGQLQVQVLPESIRWLDAGTPDALLRASTLAQERDLNGISKIGCVEEIAYRHGFITQDAFDSSVASLCGDYGDYLRQIPPNSVQ